MLALTSTVVAILLALPLGIIAAIKQNTLFDGISMFISLLGISMPVFWMGLLLILFFAGLVPGIRSRPGDQEPCAAVHRVRLHAHGIHRPYHQKLHA